jgi:hypothetical protein
MKYRANFSSLIAMTALAGALGSHTAVAQTTPGAIPNPGTYQVSMQLQQAIPVGSRSPLSDPGAE